LNRHPQSEQPKPRKLGCSIHTSFRLMASYVAAPQHLSDCIPYYPLAVKGRSVLLSQWRTARLQHKTVPSLGVAEHA
jgi:hypothetical protein